MRWSHFYRHMQTKRKTLKIFEAAYWEQGYIDLWSIIHFLSGAVWAFLPFILNLPPVQAFCISAGSLIAWEIIEVYKKVLEPLSNRILDIVVGIVGYWGLYYVLAYLEPSVYAAIVYLVIFSLALLGLSSFAWFSYSKYKDSFEKIGGKIIKVKRS